MALMGCGAAALPPTDFDAKSQIALDGAVWVSDQGDYTPHVRAQFETGKISVHPVEPSPQYVYGAHLLSVPDEREITFRSNLSRETVGTQSTTFQVYAQRGADFALLGQVTLERAQDVGSIQVDLSSYRGQEILLILSVTSADAALNDTVAWIEPRVVHP